MCSNPAAVRVFRNSKGLVLMVLLARESRYFLRSVASAADKRLFFFMDSKGDVRQFFDVRFE